MDAKDTLIEQQRAEIDHMKAERTAIIRERDVAQSILANRTEKKIEQASYIQGIERGIAESNELNWAIMETMQCIAALHTAAFCDNGKRTRLMTQEASGRLLAKLDDLDTLYKQDGRIVAIDPELQSTLAHYVAELREHTKNYLTAKIAETDERQRNLRDFISVHSQGYERLCYELKDSPKRGREKSKAIKRLLERAKPRIDSGETFEDTLDWLNVTQNNLQERWQLSKWTLDGFYRAYRRKYPVAS